MAHDQTISTRVYQSRILKTGANPKYRLCKNNKETVDHIISGCSIIVNTEYLQRSMDALGDTKLRKMVMVLCDFAFHMNREIDTN